MPRLIVKYQGKETVYDQAEDVTTIGRHEGNRLHVPDPTVSSNQCRIEKIKGAFILVDLGGKNGTRVNGVRVERHTLKAGDTIQIGATTVVFKGAATKPGTPSTGKRLLFTGQEERFVLDVATGKEAGRRFALRREKVSIGRAADCDLPLNDPTASRLHAIVLCTPTEFFIEDQRTQNGTQVNGRKISQGCPLKHGDEVRVGNTRLIFRDLQSLAHRVETVALAASELPSPGPLVEEALPNGRQLIRQLEERQRGRRRVQAVIGVAVLLLAVGVGLFFASKYKLLTFFAQKTGLVTVNLLTTNPSFEGGLVDNLPKGWSFSPGSKARWRAAAIPTGGMCLDLEAPPTNDPETWAEALCDEKVNATPGKQYQVSMRVRMEGQKGIALIKVSWLEERNPARTVLETYSSPVWGPVDWRRLTAVFSPPEGATAFRVGCVGVGNFQPIFFDDFEVYESPASEEAPAILRANAGKFSLCMDRKGLFSVIGGGKVLLTNGEGRAEGAPNGPTLRQAFASIESGFPTNPAANWCTFSTQLVDTATMTLLGLREGTKVLKGGFLGLEYMAVNDQNQARPLKWLGTVFTLPPEVVGAGIQVGSGTETTTQKGEFNLPNVSCLVFGKGEDRLVMDFSNPYRIPFGLECKRQGESYLATLSMPVPAIPPRQLIGWSLTFGKQSAQRARELIVEAREVADRGEKVAALNIYKKIVDSDFYPEDDKKIAQGEAKQIEDVIEKEFITPKRDAVDKALRSGDPDELKVAEIDVKELYERYGTTRPGAQLATLLRQIDDFRQGKLVKAADDVVELLRKAKMNYDKESWLLAKVFAENVISKGGRMTVQAKEAQQLLDTIPKAREEAKARDEFINKRLSSAATFMKNNMPAKAVPIYEEILKKYPKTRRTEEVTKLLDEAKKKLGGK